MVAKGKVALPRRDLWPHGTSVRQYGRRMGENEPASAGPGGMLSGIAAGIAKVDAAWKKASLPVKLLAFFVVLCTVGVTSFLIVWKTVAAEKKGITVERNIGQVGDNNKQDLTVRADNLIFGKLEAKRKIWSLTPETTSMLANRMAPFADGTNRDDLIAVIFWDQDTIRLGNELKTAFRSAGWKIETRGFWHVKDQTTYKAGLFLLKHSSDDEPKGFRQLASALDEAGMPPSIATDEDVPADRFRILIGGRAD